MENPSKILYGVLKGDNAIPAEWNWDYCVANKIPYILVSPKIKFTHVSVTLDTMDDGLIFPDDRLILEYWKAFYDKYRIDSEMPDDKWKLFGSSTDIGIEIWKKDYPQFVIKLYNYINDIVREHGEIDLLLREYTILKKQKNAMTTGKVPYTMAELEKLTERVIKLRYEIWDKDFNRITDYKKGRIIKFK